MGSASSRLRDALTHRRFPWVLGLTAFAAHAPGLGAGYLVDDHTHRWFARGATIPGGCRGPWDLYRFADGGAGLHEAIEAGVHPWWTDPSLKLSFFRPIPSLLRVAEEAAFGAHPLLCHLVSVLLFVATTLAVLQLFRRWIGGAAASAGALLFALDDAHATTVTWIAARHSLLAALFVTLALTAYLRERQRETPRTSVASGALLFAGLASSEAALSGLAFFAAFALLHDARPWRDRLRSLAPAGAATALWAACYAGLGHGSRASAYYIDPLRSPLRFARAAALRGPALGVGQLLGPPSEVAAMSPALGLALAAFGALFLSVFAWLTLRGLPRESPARSLLFAFGLALVPACGTNSDDRLLLVPGIAAFGLLACWGRRAFGPSPSRAVRFATVGGLFVHVGMATLLLPLRTLSMAAMLGAYVDRGAASLPTDPAIVGRDLVILSAPDGLLPSSMLAERVLSGGPVPRSSRVLTTAPASPAALTRTSADVLEIASEGGMMRDPFVGAVRPRAFVAGETVKTRALGVEVLAVDAEGMPTLIRFSFPDGALSDGSRAFVRWKDHALVPVVLPPVGGTLSLPALDFPKELASAK